MILWANVRSATGTKTGCRCLPTCVEVLRKIVGSATCVNGSAVLVGGSVVLVGGPIAFVDSSVVFGSCSVVLVRGLEKRGDNR